MIVFLAPLALFGLGLLSIPILVHLFKPRKVKVVPFTSLRWLRESQRRLSRRIKLHQILLFLLRSAFIILLVLALARPFFSPGRSQEQTERFIIMDVSRSMNYAPPYHSRPIEYGKDLYAQLTQQGLGDRTTILLAGGGGTPAVFAAGASPPQIQSMQAGLTETDLTEPLALIPPLMAGKPPDTSVELFFITDNYRHSWSQSGIARFLHDVGRPVRAHVIAVGPDRPQNAWIADAEFIRSDQPLKRTIRALVGAVGDQIQERTVRLSGIPGFPDQTRKVTVQAGRLATVEFELAPTLDLENKTAQISLEPFDALASDDRFWLSLDALAGLSVLVIEKESTQVEEIQPGIHLRTALEALSGTERGIIRVTRRSETTVRIRDLAEADVMVMIDVPALSDEVLAEMENRVQTGAGLIIFLGPSIRRDFYNSRLFDPLHPSRCLLPATIGEPVDLRKDGAALARLTDIQWTHPLLARLFDPQYGDLAQVTFQDYCQLNPDQSREGVRVLAAIDQKVPAIVETDVGLGKVLLFNTTANDAWSDLPRRKSYVPLVDRMLRYLAGGLRRGAFAVGDTVLLPLPRAAGDTVVTVTMPSGQKIQPSVQTPAGRVVMQLDAAPEPGIYQVEYKTPQGNESFPFVVQTGRRDSPLLPADEGTLRKWWEPAKFEMTASESAIPDRLPATARHSPLDPWLMIGAGLVLLAEMLLVHRLCPKAHPTIVSSSVVAQRGFFGAGEDPGSKKS